LAYFAMKKMTTDTIEKSMITPTKSPRPKFIPLSIVSLRYAGDEQGHLEACSKALEKLEKTKKGKKR
jgi:hypothetical protein